MRKRTSKSRVVRICKDILASKKWVKMTTKMGFTNEPYLRPVKFRGGVKNWLAVAGPELKINREYYFGASNKDLKHTLTHELIHYLLQDNNKNTDHTQTFKDACGLMGLNHVYAHEADYKYKYSCTCGWWYKTNLKLQGITCGKCNKSMVSPSNYVKIKKTGLMVRKIGKGEIGDRKKGIIVTCKVSIENCVPWKLK